MFHIIAAYKFTPLEGLEDLRSQLRTRCTELSIKGTILLSPEGINMFLGAEKDSIDTFLAELRAMPAFEGLESKHSEASLPPFNRMLVKIKKQIICFDDDEISPMKHSSPKIAPRTLKQWLDEGRPVTLLDTRNDYEMRIGTFKGALAPGIDHFRHFPEAVRRLPEKLKDELVVIFCTGGIRCEKVGPFLEAEGFKNVLQLEGGILKYFEECGGAHYEGECFVFDNRVAVDSQLRETPTVMCFACREPLTPADQRHPSYVFGKSCHHCAPLAQKSA